MKKFFNLILMVMLIGFITTPAMAVDSIFNHPVTSRHVPGKWSYHCSMVVDSIGSGDINYSQVFAVPASADGLYFFRSIASEVGTEDFDIYLEWVSDPRSATASFVTGTKLKDAQGTTATADTASVISGAIELPGEILGYARWKVVNGQAITASCTLTLDLGGRCANDVDVDDLPSPVDSGD